jgi:outer membrane protein insertion porin family
MKFLKLMIMGVILTGLSLPLFSQTDSLDIIDYSQVKEYEIGGVKVTGANSRDDNAIASLSGLRVGKTIQIPGQDIATAIKSLWKVKLFTDIEIVLEKTVGDIAFLEIRLKERPTLSRYSYRGVKKSKHDELNDILKTILVKGGIVTEDIKQLARIKLKEYYLEKGYLDTEIEIVEKEDEEKENSIRLIFDIDRKERVKIADIYFVGNKNVSSSKLKRKLSNTKTYKTIFKKSKFIEDDFEEDKRALIEYYNKIGFRDASIERDTIYRREEDGKLEIAIMMNEGKKYYFDDITWKGNSIYEDELLSSVLGIKKGDVYNKELLDKRLQFSLDGRDVSSLYMDKGYLFFRVEPTEVAVEDDKIDLEMRIYEGPQATIDRVVIRGNDRTHEHVVRREIRTKPGQKFSRADIIRSQREIVNLGYFNPENLGIDTPVDPQRGTVDIEYVVEERPSDQLELSAGYGGYSGLIGTLGMTFNNFSIKNVNNRDAWNPLPQGDGQKLSVRAQSNGNYYKSYNFSFTEPWFGGKKRIGMTLGGVYSKFDYPSAGTFSIGRLFTGIGLPLKWPDDYFIANATANIEQINLSDYQRSDFTISDGKFNNFSLNLSLTRSSVSEQIYPRSGSTVSLSLQITPPYSSFRGVQDYNLTEEERIAAIIDLQKELGDGTVITEQDSINHINGIIDSKKFKYLEYHKWKFNAEWYYNIWDNLVLMTSVKFGFLGYFNREIGTVPFERFEVGGDGISNYQSGITGKDIYSLRGYEVSDLEENDNGGASIFNKFTVELRYPITLNPNSTIYVLGFLQGGNSWGSFSDYNPFDLKRSAGIGLRAFLPMFGLLGFDYGFGIDRALGDDAAWTDYGKFSVILGFEPD